MTAAATRRIHGHTGVEDEPDPPLFELAGFALAVDVCAAALVSVDVAVEVVVDVAVLVLVFVEVDVLVDVSVEVDVDVDVLLDVGATVVRAGSELREAVGTESDREALGRFDPEPQAGAPTRKATEKAIHSTRRNGRPFQVLADHRIDDAASVPAPPGRDEPH
jgi:hypothetical protein